MLKLLALAVIIQSCASIKSLNGNFKDQKPEAAPQLEPESKPHSSKPVQSDKKTEQYITKFKENTSKVQRYCARLDKYFAKYEWGKSRCDDYSWNHVRNSFHGNPIVWFVFGQESKTVKKNITFIECGVHGDEITPVKFCYDLLEDLKNNPQMIGADNLVIIAPLVTPDSFFKKKPTRTNARGVDVNRNFPTKDWNKNALKLWKTRYKSDKRRFPGNKALSEQETIFQVNIIKRYKPNKVISIHAPLTLLDYDGPHFTRENGKAAKQLLVTMSDKAGKYKVSNYPFFTGSLGNWSGNERDIPTYTLELPNSDWHKTDRYYKLFRDAIHHAIGDNLQ
jgi:protein MpaA